MFKVYVVTDYVDDPPQISLFSTLEKAKKYQALSPKTRCVDEAIVDSAISDEE